jgi:hypothetical protein
VQYGDGANVFFSINFLGGDQWQSRDRRVKFGSNSTVTNMATTRLFDEFKHTKSILTFYLFIRHKRKTKAVRPNALTGLSAGSEMWSLGKTVYTFCPEPRVLCLPVQKKSQRRPCWHVKAQLLLYILYLQY